MSDRDDQPTIEDIRAAARRLQGVAMRTPVLESPWLDRESGARLLIKAECLQHTGAFKFRGAYHFLSRLGPGVRHVVAYSSGNHAQAVAVAAARLGLAATIVMPADAPKVKLAGTRRAGAEIVTYDRASEDRERVARAEADRLGAVLVPPFDHPDIIAGQGTVALELMAQAAERDRRLDAVVVPVSGGGLIAGCALALAAGSPETVVLAAEPAGYDDTGRSLSAGRRLPIAEGVRPTFCDALLLPMPGELTFAVNRQLVRAGVAVDDAAVARAMRAAFHHLRVVVEPGGAVALAAVLAGAVAAHLPDRADPPTLGVVLSGGNVDAATFCDALREGC